MKRIFFSEDGLRAGWSLATFLFFEATLSLGAQFIFATVPLLRDWSARQSHGILDPIDNIAFTGLEVFVLLVAAGIMGKIEKRSFRDYGLKNRPLDRRLFFHGMAFGFTMAAVLIGLIASFGGYSVTGVAMGGTSILWNAFLYGAGFVLVGFFEEFSFRGYMQATLGRGIGTWPAALILSLVFGAMHLPNLREGAWASALAAVCFGLLGVYALCRTGSLWFFIGAHSVFDWSIGFFFSTPIAGLPPDAPLLKSHLHGAAWLTGGTAGPVGSLMTFVVFALGGIAIRLLFPQTMPTARDRT
jgi:membrane protease YdiL (CAAX protease family)